MRFSKQLIELRYKEQKLVSLQQYEEAAQVKVRADQLKAMEQQQKEIEVGAYVLEFYLCC